MFVARTFGPFVLTAVAEIAGCYLPYLVLRKDSPVWLLLPAAISLAAFAWLLTLHPSIPTGRAYAAYGGIYVIVVLGWSWRLDAVVPDRWDVSGAAIFLIGMVIIAVAPREEASIPDSEEVSRNTHRAAAPPDPT